MAAFKLISDKGACIDWSPLKQAPNILATGTKEGGGGGFDDYGGELALQGFDSSPSTTACETLARCVVAARRPAARACPRPAPPDPLSHLLRSSAV